MDKLDIFKNWISQSSRIVFFGGAGVSTESGIPDFRSVDGLYSQKFEYPPETIISHSFYERRPEYFFRFYREKMLPLGFSPNMSWPAGKKKADSARWLPRTSMVCTKKQAVKGSTSSTAVYCVITVPAAGNFTVRSLSGTPSVFPGAAAAVS